jgi:hypothetical protein
VMGLVDGLIDQQEDEELKTMEEAIDEVYI